MKNISRETGKKGELLALNFFKSLGFSFVKNNFHSRYGEIDIIFENKKYIIFIEVKTRKTMAKVSGVESVNRKKQEKILKTASIFLSENKIKKQPRFDVLEILKDKKIGYRFNHIENAFGEDCSYAFF